MTSQTTNTAKNIAIVTGGSRGIGKAIALQLAQQGNTVVVNYHSNIAGIVGFFCSPPSRWVSGQVIRANGALI